MKFFLVLFIVSVYSYIPFSPAGRVDPINNYETDDQKNPVVAGLTGGGYVVVWASINQDTSSWGIYSRVFSNADVPSNEVLVNSQTDYFQSDPCVTPIIDGPYEGGFVVAYNSYNYSGIDAFTEIAARIFYSDGSAASTEFMVNTLYTTSWQAYPKSATLSGGNFVIVWQSAGVDSSGFGVRLMQYSNVGASQSIDPQVNTMTNLQQQFPNVAASPIGNKFVVVWETNHFTDPNFDIWGRIYTGLLPDYSSEIKLNDWETYNQIKPSVTFLANNNIVLGYTSCNEDNEECTGVLSVLDPTLTRISEEKVPWSSPAPDNYEYCVVTSVQATNGDNLIVIVTASELSINYEVIARMYREDLTEYGDIWQVNTLYNVGLQSNPSLAGLTNNNFVIVYDGQNIDSNLYGVMGERYIRPPDCTFPSFSMYNFSECNNFGNLDTCTPDNECAVDYCSDGISGEITCTLGNWVISTTLDGCRECNVCSPPITDAYEFNDCLDDVQSGDTCIPTGCKVGYNDIGLTGILGCYDGSWSGMYSGCQITECQNPIPLNPMYLLPSSCMDTKHFEYCRPERCHYDYCGDAKNYTTFIFCYAESWIGMLQGCHNCSNCVDSPTLDGYFFEDCSNSFHNDTCNALYCTYGFEGAPTSYLTCDDGDWGMDMTGCTRKPCEDPDYAGYNFNTSACVNMAHGDICIPLGTCATNYCGSSSGQITCDDGNWISTLDGCPECDDCVIPVVDGYNLTHCTGDHNTGCTPDDSCIDDKCGTPSGTIFCFDGTIYNFLTDCGECDDCDSPIAAYQNWNLNDCPLSHGTEYFPTLCSYGYCGEPEAGKGLSCYDGEWTSELAGCPFCTCEQPDLSEYSFAVCPTNQNQLCYPTGCKNCGEYESGFIQCDLENWNDLNLLGCHPCDNCDLLVDADYDLTECTTEHNTNCTPTACTYCGTPDGSKDCLDGEWVGDFTGCHECANCDAQIVNFYNLDSCSWNHGMICNPPCSSEACGVSSGYISCYDGEITNDLSNCLECQSCQDDFDDFILYNTTTCSTEHNSVCNPSCNSGLDKCGSSNGIRTCINGEWIGEFSGCHTCQDCVQVLWKPKHYLRSNCTAAHGSYCFIDNTGCDPKYCAENNIVGQGLCYDGDVIDYVLDGCHACSNEDASTIIVIGSIGGTVLIAVGLFFIYKYINKPKLTDKKEEVKHEKKESSTNNKEEC